MKRISVPRKVINTGMTNDENARSDVNALRMKGVLAYRLSAGMQGRSYVYIPATKKAVNAYNNLMPRPFSMRQKINLATAVKERNPDLDIQRIIRRAQKKSRRK